MTWYAHEARALADTLLRVGPDAPTLCQGWRTRDLVAHLVLRDQRPWAIALDALSRPEPGFEQRQRLMAQSVTDASSWSQLIDRFLVGPPWFSPMKLLGDAGELMEYVVHHEDVLRAQKPAGSLQQRPAELERRLWRYLQFVAKARYRKSPVGVVLAVSLGPSAVVRRAADSVVLRGTLADLLMHAFGRVASSGVEVGGTDSSRLAFQNYVGVVESA